MPEVTSFLAHQSIASQAGLFVAALVVLLTAGGLVLSLVVHGLDRLGAALTSNPDWQPRGAISKEETLLLISVVFYAQLAITLEPALRELASVAGEAAFTSLLIAPIAGMLLRGARARA